MKNWCTLAPDKIGSYDLGACCKLHDEAYELQEKSRKECDLELKTCISKASTPLIGWVYYLAVRWVGWFNWWRCKNG